MAKTWRKVVVWRDNRGGSKQAKRTANRRVRKTYDVSNGRWYKRLSESWDIVDYKWRGEDKINESRKRKFPRDYDRKLRRKFRTPKDWSE